ncbi:MAG: tRNA dihydrouridine synthase DusB [Agarilytica sp.]
MFNIGPHVIKSRVLLAPMAGVTDLPFRKICQNMGAGLTTSEMVTSDVSLWNSEKSHFRLIHNNNSDIPHSVQIAGSVPSQLADAAQHAVASGAQIVDINMGCPAKKVCKKLAGSALLQDETLVGDILKAVVDAVDVPVTLKIRTGWDTQHRNGVRIAKIAQDHGIQAIAVHGRTRACRFVGEVEYDTIKHIVDAVNIPIYANGDINSAEKAKQVIEYTGATAVMIGRAACGNPWIFEQANRLLERGTICALPEETTITSVMTTHFMDLYKHYGEHKGTRIARKHFGWYCQQYGGSSVAKIRAFNQLETIQSQLDAVKDLFRRPLLDEERVA